MEEITQTQPEPIPKKKVLKRSKTLGETAPPVVTKEYIKKLIKEIEEEDDSVILNKKDREVIRQCDKDLIESEKEVKQNKNHRFLCILSDLELEDYENPLNEIMSNYGAVIKYLENKTAENGVMKWQMDDYWMVKLFHKELEQVVKQYEKFRTDILMSLN
jgi:hypothetical protein